MKVDKEKKRLKAIKLKYVLFSTKCMHCGEEYKREKMWRVFLYGPYDAWYKHHYCQKCMHSAKDVLTEIDTKPVGFGIAGVDGLH